MNSPRTLCPDPDPLPPTAAAMASPPAAATIFPREILEEIFVRLPTPADLARASAACTSFRLIIKGPAFRRRFRALHRPALLGFMDVAGFHPAQPPHPSAPLAQALAPCAASSSYYYSFVPPVVVQDRGLDLNAVDYDGPRWRPRDVRDGRVLLDWVSVKPRMISRRICREDGSDVVVLVDCSDFPDDIYHHGAHLKWAKRERCNAADFHLAVCDPLSRRYLVLPTIPEDLAAWPQERLHEFEPVLAPTTGDDGEDEYFRVICLAGYQTKLLLFVYNSTTRQWYAAAYSMLTPLGTLPCFDCVRGCFYWTMPWTWCNVLLVLDTRTMRFSTVNLLTGYHVQLRDLPDQCLVHRRPHAIVVGREGALEMFSLVCQHGSFALHHTTLQNNSQEWRLEKIIQLPGQYHDYSISTVGAAEGFFFFGGAQDVLIQDVDCFSLDVKTYEITKVCSKMEQSNREQAHPSFGFPPCLSDPTV